MHLPLSNIQKMYYFHHGMHFFFHQRVCAFTTMAFTVLVTCEISTEILPYKTKILIEDLLKFPVCHSRQRGYRKNSAHAQRVKISGILHRALTVTVKATLVDAQSPYYSSFSCFNEQNIIHNLQAHDLLAMWLQISKRNF